MEPQNRLGGPIQGWRVQCNTVRTPNIGGTDSFNCSSELFFPYCACFHTCVGWMFCQCATHMQKCKTEMITSMCSKSIYFPGLKIMTQAEVWLAGAICDHLSKLYQIYQVKTLGESDKKCFFPSPPPFCFYNIHINLNCCLDKVTLLYWPRVGNKIW